MTHPSSSRRSVLPWLVGLGVLLGGGVSATLDLTSASAAGTSGGSASSTGPSTGTASGAGSQCGTCAGNSGNGTGNGASGTTPTAKALTVTAVKPDPVAPGVPGKLTVSVVNPNNQAVVLKSVTGTVTQVTSGSRAGLKACDKAWIVITPFTGSTTVAKAGTATVVLPVTFVDLPTVNQDNCKGATYTYTFSAGADQS